MLSMFDGIDFSMQQSIKFINSRQWMWDRWSDQFISIIELVCQVELSYLSLEVSGGMKA